MIDWLIEERRVINNMSKVENLVNERPISHLIVQRLYINNSAINVFDAASDLNWTQKQGGIWGRSQWGEVRQVVSPPFPFPPLPLSIPLSFQTNQWEGRSDPVRGEVPRLPPANTSHPAQKNEPYITDFGTLHILTCSKAVGRHHHTSAASPHYLMKFCQHIPDVSQGNVAKSLKYGGGRWKMQDWQWPSRQQSCKNHRIRCVLGGRCAVVYCRLMFVYHYNFAVIPRRYDHSATTTII